MNFKILISNRLIKRKTFSKLWCYILNATTKSYLHHVDWVGPEVMLASLFHNCLEVILITNYLLEKFVIKIE